MTDEVVITEVRGRVLLVTLNRPDARNAITLEVAEAVSFAMDRLDAADELRVGVLTGVGPAFCAGMDLKVFSETGQEPMTSSRGFAGLVQSLPHKPLIAAVEGAAVAGGCEIALACDLVVAARGSRFGLPEVKRGLIAAGGGLLRLPLAIGDARATELALTGELVPADELHRLGAINRLVEDGDAMQEALTLADTIAANAPLAVEGSLQILRERRAGDRGFWSRQEAIVQPVFASADAREGALSYIERRAPMWRRR